MSKGLGIFLYIVKYKGDNVEKYVIIDSKLRKIEREYLKSLGYKLIEIKPNLNLYDEISSHVDIFCCNIEDKLVLEKNLYNLLKGSNFSFKNKEVICGEKEVQEKYPLDVLYNVCTIGKNVVHNFRYTDKKIQDVITKEKLNRININQGYTNCSIAVIDESSVIVTDKKIALELAKHNIEVLLVENINGIKLLKNCGRYSAMTGFIGGCMSRVEDKIIVFGDLCKIDKSCKIRDFIRKKNLEIIDFKGYDVIDYGGIVCL